VGPSPRRVGSGILTCAADRTRRTRAAADWQRQIRRAFIAHEVSATVIYRWCRRWQAPKLGRLERWSIVRILDVIADRRGRASTIGRPWIWRLKTPAADILSASSDRNH